jgi:hypothetical protein
VYKYIGLDIAFVSCLFRSHVHTAVNVSISLIPDNSSIVPSNGNQNRNRSLASPNGYISSHIGTCSAISKHIHFSLRHRCLGKQRGVDVVLRVMLPPRCPMCICMCCLLSSSYGITRQAYLQPSS